MLPRPTTPFLAFAGDLYTPTALDPPPSSVAAPPPRADWTSYAGPDSIRSPEYRTFERSPAFLEIHRQWLERLTDCERFATQRCSPAEAAAMRAGLQRMRSILEDQYGTRFAGSKMTLLYGQAKRAMDRFCQRLAQEELPLEFRSARLRELTGALHLCQAAGPAFLRAADAMDTPVEGLRGAFWDIFANRSDDALRRIFNSEHPDEGRRGLMEVHGVNRLRLEYKLPGGTQSDLHSFGTDLFHEDQQPRHQRILREALDPVQVAEDLADRYWQALSSKLAATVPGRASRENLGPAMPSIQEAVTELDVALHPVSMNSLLELDPDTEEIHWQAHSSLLTLDMLQALEREAIVVEQPRDTLATLEDPQSRRQLERVGRRLFLISETLSGWPTPSLHQVRVDDLLKLEPTLPTPLPAYWDTLVTTAIRGDTTAELGRVPPRWLSTHASCQAWLARVNEAHWTQWLKDQPSLSPHHVLCMAGALNRLDRADWLKSLLETPQLSDATWQTAHAKPLLMVAVKASTPSTQEVWRHYWRHAIARLDAGTSLALLAPAGQANLLSRALQRKLPFEVSLTADLVTTALASHVIPRSKATSLLNCPLQSVMKTGPRTLLEPLRDLILTAIRQHWINRNDLMKWLSESGLGCGCEGALACTDDEPLQWYLALIDQLLAEGQLDASAVRRLMADPEDDGSMVSHEAVHHRSGQALTTYFGWLMNAVQAKRIPKERLLQQLTCNSRETMGLDTMLDSVDKACLTAWQAVLVRAVERGLITTASVETLLTALDEHGQPALHRVIDVLGAEPGLPNASGSPHSAWFRTVAELHRDHALDSSQFINLLRGGVHRIFGVGSPLLYRLIVRNSDPQRLLTYLSNLVELKLDHLLTAEELEFLVGAPHRRKKVSALVALIQNRDVRALQCLVNQLIRMGLKGCLPSPALVRLLNGQIPGVHKTGGRTALVTAIRNKDAAALKVLMDASLEMAGWRSVKTQDWLTLLYPDDKDANPVTALRRANHPPSLDLFRSGLASAKSQGLLTEPQWRELLSGLPPASPVADDRPLPL